jgi:hypothetical protein
LKYSSEIPENFDYTHIAPAIISGYCTGYQVISMSRLNILTVYTDSRFDTALFNQPEPSRLNYIPQDLDKTFSGKNLDSIDAILVLPDCLISDVQLCALLDLSIPLFTAEVKETNHLHCNVANLYPLCWPPDESRIEEIIAASRNLQPFPPHLPTLPNMSELQIHGMYSISITLPALRDRKSDITLLARHFLRQLCDEYEQAPRSFHPESIAWLEQQPWPGNIRKLKSRIHSEFLISDKRIMHINVKENENLNPHPAISSPGLQTLKKARAEHIQQFEQEYLHELMLETGSNVTHAARLGGQGASLPG